MSLIVFHTKTSLHFVESALFCRGRAKAQETAHILVREFARRDKIPLQMTLLHLMRVIFFFFYNNQFILTIDFKYRNIIYRERDYFIEV